MYTMYIYIIRIHITVKRIIKAILFVAREWSKNWNPFDDWSMFKNCKCLLIQWQFTLTFGRSRAANRSYLIVWLLVLFLPFILFIVQEHLLSIVLKTNTSLFTIRLTILFKKKTHTLAVISWVCSDLYVEEIVRLMLWAVENTLVRSVNLIGISIFFSFNSWTNSIDSHVTKAE